MANLKTNNILIRCDASPAIGLGHITRCLVLADDFRDKGHKVYFAMRNYTLGITKAREKNFEVFIANEKNFEYKKWIQTVVEKYNPTCFIGDVRDHFPKSLISDMKDKGILTVAIDEPSEYAKECDLAFYPPHSRIDMSLYRGKVFQGLHYTILREEFYLPQKKTKNKNLNIMIMIGGTDTHNLSLPIVNQLLSSSKENFSLSVVISRKHQDYTKLENIDKKVKLYSDIKNMADFMRGIDYAVVSFGTSVYELLTLQIPFITICLDQEHWSSSSYFEQLHYTKRYTKELFEVSIDEFATLQTAPKIDINQNKVAETIYENL